MPTESSVVASLIRDLNTRRLPSEPADAFLFQPVPARQAEQAARAIKPPEIAKKVVAKASVSAKVPDTAKPRSAVMGWLQFVLATALCGAWGYAAFQLDADAESSTPAALVLPSASITPAPPPAPSIQPAQAAAPSAVPATAPAPAPAPAPAEPAAQAPTVEPIVEPLPAPEPTVVEAAAAPAPAPSHAPKKHHHRASKTKANVAQTKATSKPSASASTAAPAPVPVSPPPAKPVAAPSKPMQQSDDSEDPLK